ncbi:hypothetical protein PPACK8108_LOCUS135 [Phakopsora pachyrhizi]|uniref:Uncharacterized protein n=1 Tax=Phakopsora pachyrhizi TaxID=170000 RepID=A0AAV0ADF7_PHAPC|nr:hypothetical protein PPACK8108_LOCUS135 [Phakopsora pachyrhizi]
MTLCGFTTWLFFYYLTLIFLLKFVISGLEPKFEGVDTILHRGKKIENVPLRSYIDRAQLRDYRDLVLASGSFSTSYDAETQDTFRHGKYFELLEASKSGLRASSSTAKDVDNVGK